MSSEKEQVTLMILYVDLKCSCCYKKVRKLLCKIPEIRDQVFDEEKNKVMITVVCCDPQKMRDKLCCRGGKAIQSIEIPQPPPPPPVKKTPPVKIPVPDTQTQTQTKPNPVKVPNSQTPPPVEPPPPPPVIKPPVPPFCPPVSVCCQECYESRGGGPCHYWYGRPPAGPCYDYGYQYAGNRPPCYVSRCDCFSEENPQGCSVM